MIWLLPVLTGFLLVACFPRIDLGILAWAAWVPLIIFIFYCRSAARAFAGGWIAAAIQLFILLIWIPPVLARYGGLSAVLAWVAYGLAVSLLACFPAVACAATKILMVRGGNPFLMILPVVWVALEWAQSVFPFGGFPWLLAGYSQTGFLPLIQIADITGIYGVSFLILWTNAAIAFLLLRASRRACWAPALAAAIALAVSLAYGGYSLRRWGNAQPSFRAAMLQGNLSFDDPEAALIEKFREGYPRMADGLKTKPDLLVLPESPTPVLFQFDTSYRRELDRLAARFPLGMVFNNIDCRESGGENQNFNSAFFLDGNGSLKGVYDKIHLVPFGEYIPVKRLFFFAETISKDVGEFQAGRDFRIIDIGNHPSNAIICFEAAFPGLVRRFVEKGSQVIVNLTNDGWYGRSAAPYQHLAIARWRAVENRRYLLRAANSGFSAIIEPTGRVQSVTGLMQEGICEGRFAFLSEKTIYTRYGDIGVYLCAAIFIAAIFLAADRSAAKKAREGGREERHIGN
jgi:apolipoprotein N-acyltransferase